jgi:hypothetical protein
MDEKIEEKVGYWVYSEKGCVINCSSCGERLELCYPDGTEIRATKYCPNCGAKMDKEQDLTGGMRCRPIRVEVQNLVYLMGEWAIENNMCWNDEHAKKLAYYLLDNNYRKGIDTAREILTLIKNGVELNSMIGGEAKIAIMNELRWAGQKYEVK